MLTLWHFPHETLLNTMYTESTALFCHDELDEFAKLLASFRKDSNTIKKQIYHQQTFSSVSYMHTVDITQADSSAPMILVSHFMQLL